MRRGPARRNQPSKPARAASGGAVTGRWPQVGCVLAAVVFWAPAARTHDWYEGIQLEREGMEPLDCCGGKDCAPFPHRTTAGELGYEVQIKGSWYSIDRGSIVGEFSPDGQVHVCCLDGCEAYAQPQIRCVILPGHGT